MYGNECCSICSDINACAKALRKKQFGQSIANMKFYIWQDRVHLIIMAWCAHMTTETGVNIGSDNGLLSDGTKPLSEPMLTYL